MNNKNYFGLILTSFFIIATGSSCSNTVKYHITFEGEHLHYNGNTEFAANALVVGNISADDGYYIPNDVSIKGISVYTYNPSNGDISFTITDNVTIVAEACYSLKFYSTGCTATGEGFTHSDNFDLRFPYHRTEPLKFYLEEDDAHILPIEPNIEVKLDGSVATPADYAYDSYARTFEIKSLNHLNIEARISATNSYPINFEIEHASAINMPAKLIDGQIVNFTIKPDEGYILPDQVEVEGVTNYNYTKNPTTGYASFTVTDGMPKNAITIKAISTLKKYDVKLSSDYYYFKTSISNIGHGKAFINKIESYDISQHPIPENIRVTVDDRVIDNFTYSDGNILIPVGVITGPLNIETELMEKTFPFNLISDIATSTDVEDEYIYNSEVKVNLELNTGYKNITNYEVIGATDYSLVNNVFTLSNMPANPVTLKILKGEPKSFDFVPKLTGCHFINDPKDQYAYGESVSLQLAPNNANELMPIVQITGLKNSEYEYNHQTGVLNIFAMPANDVTINATCYSELINIDNEYQIVVNEDDRLDYSCAHQINEAVEHYLGFTLDIVDSTRTQQEKEIVFVNQSTNENSYGIKVSDQKISITSDASLAKICAIDRLLTDYIYENHFIVPTNLDIKGNCTKNDTNIKDFKVPSSETSGHINELRDPFIVEQPKGDGTNKYDYYMYGTIDGGDDYWKAFKCQNGISEETNDWQQLGYCCEQYFKMSNSRWAPEVYQYNGDYYMFTTFNYNMDTPSGDDDVKGVTVMKSSSLEPNADKFKIISYDNAGQFGWISPHQEPGLEETIRWYIDGSLYVDEQGEPWITLVDNFRRTPDKHGRMAVAKLSKDLTHMISEPHEIFNARDVSWVGPFDKKDGDDGHWITDGPFVYRTKSGKLLMQWSSYTNESTGIEPNNYYGIGFATSENGSMLGDWKHHDRLLFERNMYSDLMGGHGEFFMDHTNNQMYMCFHSPNSQDEELDNQEHPLLIPVKEAYDTIVWDLYQH